MVSKEKEQRQVLSTADYPLRIQKLNSPLTAAQLHSVWLCRSQSTAALRVLQTAATRSAVKHEWLPFSLGLEF